MKNNSLVLAFILTLTCFGTLHASNVMIDGLYYNLKIADSTAILTRDNNDYYAYQDYTEVIIPETITYQNIPYTVWKIDEYAFAGCTRLKSLVVPNTVTSVGYRAIHGCDSLAYLEVPDISMIYTLPNRLKHVVINGGGVDNDAFDRLRLSASYLSYLELSGVTNTTLPIRALYDCYRLDTLFLPDGLELLDYMALAECVNLKNIEIPASVQEIGDRAFENCRMLNTVTFNGENLSRIGNWAFFQCLQLQNITIPEGVTEIGYAAFYGCAYLNEVTLPSTTQQLGDQAFASCSRMTKMYVDAAFPPTIDSKTFDKVSRSMPVYVPDASVNAYQADTLWGQLNIVGASHEGTSLTNTNSTTTSIRKIIVNGLLYILLPDGIRYEVTGKKIE